MRLGVVKEVGKKVYLKYKALMTVYLPPKKKKK